MLRGNGLIRQFDNSSLCFVSSLQCINARISVMRIISSNQCSASDHFHFLKLIKIREIMRVFTWSFGVWKNHHEIEEGSRPLPAWAVVVRTSIKSLGDKRIQMSVFGFVLFGCNSFNVRPWSLSLTALHPSSLLFSWFGARREKWNRGFMQISQIGGEFIWSVYQQWWVLKWPQTWTINFALSKM